MIDSLIDSEGALWPCHTPSLRRRLGTSLSAADLVAYVVRNMGWVGLGLRDSGAHIALRPAAVQPLTLARTIEWLADRTPSRCLVAAFDESEKWAHHVCSSPQGTTRKIIELTQPYVSADDRLLSRALGPEQLASDTRLGALWKVWRNQKNQATLDELWPVLHGHLDARFVVVTPHENGDLPIVTVGQGLPLFNGQLSAQRPGSRLQDGADVYYANWAAKGYFEVHRTDIPRFDAIDGCLKIPRLADRRTTYRRLILPIKAADGSRALLSASMIDPSIELRLQAS